MAQRVRLLLAMAILGVLAGTAMAGAPLGVPALDGTGAVRPSPAAFRQNGNGTGGASYRLEADVSLRSIPVDVRFSGARVVMFGSVNLNGPAPLPDAGPLDVVAVIQGANARLTVRRKGNVGGIWINTNSVEFEQAPRFYAVMSTRPLELIAQRSVLADNGIGFEQVPISTALGDSAGVKPKVIETFRAAAIDLGIRQKHYVRQDAGIFFVGKSLFRGQIDLPASIPVGELDVTFYLFRSGELMTRQDSRVELKREGFEQFVYEFAHRLPLFYGIATVLMAAAVGLMSSYIVSLRSR
jgi:uncharacterized protein (TIGR02186 family)